MKSIIVKNTVSSLLIVASYGLASTAYAEPSSYNSSTQTLTLPFVEMVSNYDTNATSYAEAKLSWKPSLQYFTLDSVAVMPIENKIVIGNDANSINNTVVQPTDPALSGGGKNQSLNFGDIVMGGHGNDILIGGLGIDVLMGKAGNDILIGGTEDFNPENRDRAFGGPGNDTFIWAPGDGSDFFHGGSGTDVVIFGKIAEIDGEGSKFTVEKDKNFDGIFLDPATHQPSIDVTSSPGFCTILDRSQYSAEFDTLGVDHLVRFALRGKADAFEAATQTDDNGVRVTLHLKGVEYVVCTSRSGGEIEVFNIGVQPAVKENLSDLPQYVQNLIQ